MSARVSKKLVVLLALIFLMSPELLAFDITAGLNFGRRWIDDPNMKDIYGHGYVFQPFLRYNYSGLLAVEAAYEGGYKREGRIGLFQEDSTLSITGWEITGVAYYHLFNFVPYVKFGVGYYTYRQDIASEFVRLEVDHHKTTFVLGGGVNIYLNENFFLNAEVKYAPLKVSPFDVEVDLSGMRFILGLGYRFAL